MFKASDKCWCAMKGTNCTRLPRGAAPHCTTPPALLAPENNTDHCNPGSYGGPRVARWEGGETCVCVRAKYHIQVPGGETCVCPYKVPHTSTRWRDMCVSVQSTTYKYPVERYVCGRAKYPGIPRHYTALGVEPTGMGGLATSGLLVDQSRHNQSL